jgi:hypothetical protein
LEGDFSAEFKDFVSQCLQKDPSKRPKANELLDHPFIKRSSSINIKRQLLSSSSYSSDGKHSDHLSPVLSGDGLDSHNQSHVNEVVSQARIMLEEPNTPNTAHLGSSKRFHAIDPLLDGQMIKVNKSSDTIESAASRLLRMDGSGSDDSIGTKLLLSRPNASGQEPSSLSSTVNAIIPAAPLNPVLSPSSSSKSFKTNLSPNISPSHAHHDGIAIATSSREIPVSQKRLNWVKKTGVSQDQFSPVISSMKRPPVGILAAHDQSSPLGSHKSVAFEGALSPPVLSSSVPSDFLTLVRHKVEYDHQRMEAEMALLESRGLQRIGSTDSGSAGGWDFTYRSNTSTNNQAFSQNHHSQSHNASKSNSRGNSVVFVASSLTSSNDLDQQMAMTVPRKHADNSSSPDVSFSSYSQLAKHGLDYPMSSMSNSRPALDPDSFHFQNPLSLSRPEKVSESDHHPEQQHQQSSSSSGVAATSSGPMILIPSMESSQSPSAQSMISSPMPHRSITTKVQVKSIFERHMKALNDVFHRVTSNNEENQTANTTSNNLVISSTKLSELYLAAILPAILRTETQAKAFDQWQPKKNYLDTIIRDLDHDKAKKMAHSRSASAAKSDRSGRTISPTPESKDSTMKFPADEAAAVEQENFSQTAVPILSSLLATATNTARVAEPSIWFSKVFGFSSPAPEQEITSTAIVSNVEPMTSSTFAGGSPLEDVEDGVIKSSQQRAVDKYQQETEELVNLLLATLTALDIHTNGEITREFILQIASYVADEADGHI